MNITQSINVIYEGIVQKDDAKYKQYYLASCKKGLQNIAVERNILQQKFFYDLHHIDNIFYANTINTIICGCKIMIRKKDS